MYVFMNKKRSEVFCFLETILRTTIKILANFPVHLEGLDSKSHLNMAEPFLVN